MVINGANNRSIQEKMDLLFSEILMEQQKYMQVRPADPEKKIVMDNMTKDFAQLKGRELFYNYMSTGRGHGPFTELVDGSVKYDLIGAIGPNLLGHSHPLTIKAHLEAACNDVVYCGNLLSHMEAYKLTKAVLQTVPKTRLKHFWFSCSGSFANDVALKIIWQKKAPKYKVIAFEKAFAGRSIATQDITHNASYREGMPKTIDVRHVPHFDQNDPANSTKKTIDALNKLWSDEGDTFCAITMEIIQGEGGFIFGTKEYYETVFKWAKSKGLYIWVDEVQSFGRTEQLFAFQTFGLDEYIDVVTVAKALQACGTFYTEELNPKPGLIAGTFNGSIAALTAGEKVLNFLMNGNFFGPNGRNRQLEKIFTSKLQELKDGSCKGKIGYIGGIGTMLSFEIGDSGADVSKKFIYQLFDNGVLSFTAGKSPTRIRFLIPVTLTEQHINEIFKIIEKTIHEVVK